MLLAKGGKIEVCCCGGLTGYAKKKIDALLCIKILNKSKWKRCTSQQQQVKLKKSSLLWKD